MRTGYHASPHGHTQREIDTFSAAPPAAILWLGGNHQPENGAQYPSAWHLVRLPTPAVDESPVQYASAMERIIGPWRAIEGALNALWFIPGNEPEYADKSDVIVAWGVGQWLDAAPGYASALRSLYPGIRLAAPALMAEHTDQLTPAYADAFDLCTAHAYWQIQDEPGIRWHLGGGSYTHALAVAGKTVVVTEVGVVSPSGVYADASQMDWDARNAQLATWIGEADAAGVSACCLFVADASPDFACFDIGPEAAAAIRAGVIPPAPVPVPPPPEPPMSNPYVYDGDYSFDTFRAMMDGPLLAKNPSAASRANYRGCHAAAKAEGVSVPTLVGWIKAENVDPALFAVNNLAGIYYVGQSRATPGPMGPAGEGSKPYCAFATPEDFWVTLAINIATVDPDAWAWGDLRTIAREYTGGPWGEVKVQLVDALRNIGVYPHGSIDDSDAGSDDSGGSDHAPAQHYPLVYPVDAPVAQGSMGTFSHGGASPGFYAIDFACDRGTPCRACADGTVGVIYTGDWNPISARTGPSIWIDHDNGYSTFSCHMSRIDVATGQRVAQGQTIGLTGDPTIDGGYAGDPPPPPGSDPHLHFEIWRSGVRVRMEDLEAEGIIGPWADTSQEDESIVVTVDGHIDDGRLDTVWYGRPKPTQTQLKTMPRVKGHGIPDRWEAEFRGKKCLGQCLTKEMDVPDGSGARIQYFANGWIVWYPDGSTSVN